ncbi:hypothetical protein D3C76_1606090 [compost metagenome]
MTAVLLFYAPEHVFCIAQAPSQVNPNGTKVHLPLFAVQPQAIQQTHFVRALMAVHRHYALR